jgi:hypothetical protein
MKIGPKALLGLGLAALGVAGCNQHRPNDYHEQRGDVDALDREDRGLQSKDVVTASNQMARDLLTSPDLRRSKEQWTMVVTTMKDHTRGGQFGTNYDIFIERLRTELASQGRGQVTLVTNKAKITNLRNKELDGERDDFQQGGGGGRGMSRVQPDFALRGDVYNMPNRANDFYLLSFTVTDLKSGTDVWVNKYEVKVAR